MGPLYGVPFGVKDLEDVKGLPTSYGAAPLKVSPHRLHRCYKVQRSIVVSFLLELFADRLTRRADVMIASGQHRHPGLCGRQYTRNL